MGVSSSPTRYWLATWNPSEFEWEDFDEAVTAAKDAQLEWNWSTGNTKSIMQGERFFLLRQNTERGIIGSGTTKSNVETGDHFNNPRKTSNYVEIEFDVLLPVSQVLPIEDVMAAAPDFSWNRVIASGWSIPDEVAAQVEELWQKHLTAIGVSPHSHAAK